MFKLKYPALTKQRLVDQRKIIIINKRITKERLNEMKATIVIELRYEHKQ